MSRLRSLAVRAGLASGLLGDDRRPVYVQAHGAVVALDGERLKISADGTTTFARLEEISQLVLMGAASLTTPALHALMRRNIAVSWHSLSGWFLGLTVGLGHGNVELRLAQYGAAQDPQRALAIARRLVVAKLAGCAQRCRRLDGDLAGTSRRLRNLADRATMVDSLDALRGIEGTGAALYWQAFASMLRPPRDADRAAFHFAGRRFHPPPDPVNALLSFSYALLVRSWMVTLVAQGFDPLLGFYHRPRYGRPALALDMMEPFRSVIADSAVLTVLNNGEIRATDFSVANDDEEYDEAVAPNARKSRARVLRLTPEARRTLVEAFDRRLDRLVKPSHLGYRLSYRRLCEVQARLLARYLNGTSDDFPQAVPE